MPKIKIEEIKFSSNTATLLKNIPNIAQLVWNENKLDLAQVKQLKGCRTELVRDCLRFIQKLDSLVEEEIFNSAKKKHFVDNTIQSLIAGLKTYSASCEYYPRIKDFLNSIPDNISGIVGFTLVISALLTTVFPPLAVVPLLILSWIMMDLFFNNRVDVDDFKAILYTAKDELRTIEEAADILNKKQATHTLTENSPIPIPSTSGTSSNFYGTVNPVNQTSSMEDSTSRLTPS